MCGQNWAARAALGLAGLALVVGAQACARPGEASLTGEVVERSVAGSADDAGEATPPARYDSVDDAWAADSLTTAYSDPPRYDRVSGGVAAEPADTGTGGLAGSPATARSTSRVASVLDVAHTGTFRFDLGIELRDLELAGGGSLIAGARAFLEDAEGARIPMGDIAATTLEVRPDGSVIIDEDDLNPGEVEANYAFTRTVTGPPGGIRLERGRYRVVLELTLRATAPARSGPGQLARIGQGMATIRLKG